MNVFNSYVGLTREFLDLRRVIAVVDPPGGGLHVFCIIQTGNIAEPFQPIEYFASYRAIEL